MLAAASKSASNELKRPLQLPLFHPVLWGMARYFPPSSSNTPIYGRNYSDWGNSKAGNTLFSGGMGAFIAFTPQ